MSNSSRDLLPIQLMANEGSQHGELSIQPVSSSTGTVVSRIESILESIIDDISAQRPLSIEFSIRRSSRQRNQQIHFPGRSLQEAKKFARVVLILQLAHDALVSGIILTKRHIFYQHQDLFEKQRVVDDLVDDLALTLGINRDDLNIVASAKGVFLGPLTIRLHDETVIECSAGDAGTPLPTNKLISSIDCSMIKWIVVVEKDATFRSLTSARYCHTSSIGPGLIITAKGYPDVITRSFLRLVRISQPQLPICVLTDFDPDGLNIFCCYYFESGSSGCEMRPYIPGLTWLGIKSKHLQEFGADLEALGIIQNSDESQETHLSQGSAASRTSISSTGCREPISYLTLRDRKAAIRILHKLACCSADDQEAIQVQHELKIMMMMDVKAEIQWLDEAGSITDWLDSKLGEILYTHESYMP